jgi:tetratricopeptide (TPR) repeat protein
MFSHLLLFFLTSNIYVKVLLHRVVLLFILLRSLKVYDTIKFRFLIIFSFFILQGFTQVKEEIDSVNNLSYTYISNNLQHCKIIFEKNIEKAKKIQYKYGIAKAYKNCSTVYSLLGDYKQSILYNQKAMPLLEELKKYSEVAQTYADLGFRIRYFDHLEAINYFQKAIQIGEKHDIGGSLSHIYNNYSEVIADNDIDKAVYFAEKSLKICRKYNDTIGIPFSLNNLSVYYSRKKQFEKAFNCLKESDYYRYRNHDQSGIADNLAYYGDVYFEIPKNDSAIYFYEKSYEMAKKIQYNPLERYCLKQLANLYQKQKKFQNAFNTFKLFKNMEDSVLNLSVKNELANLQVKYDTEKVKLNLAENQIKLASRQKLLIASVGGLVILLGVIFFVYRYQRTKRKTQLKEVLLNQELEKTILEKEFGDEKIRIARELHDNIGSHLTFMISSLDNLSYVQQQEKIDKIIDLSNFGRETMKELRDTIWAMNHDDGEVDQLLLTRISALRSVLPATSRSPNRFNI